MAFDYTESDTLGNIIVKELWPEFGYCREVVTVVSGQNLSMGEVVSVITASGKYTSYDPDGADGSQTAVGSTCEAIDASSADATGTVLLREAILNGDNLVWGHSGITAAEKTTAKASMKTKGIVTTPLNY